MCARTRRPGCLPTRNWFRSPRLKESADIQVYRCLSLRIGVRTDVDDVAEYGRRLFRRFLSSETDADTTLEIVSDPAGGWRVRDEIIDATVHERAWLAGILCARVLETAGNCVADHDLFHAAALSRDGRGLVLCGESGFGKSTLTLALIAAGWKFLSDEVAALDGDRRLQPFPKALELVPGTARRVGVLMPDHPDSRGKTLHDPEELFPGCVGEAVPLQTVIFLADDGSPGQAASSTARLQLTVHRRSDTARQAILAEDGVLGVAWDETADGYPVLVVDRDASRFAAWRLDEMLAAHGLLIVGSSSEETPPNRFDREPELQPMERHAGVAELLARFRGRRAFQRKIDAHGGDFASVFLAMLDRFAETRFYRMQVGKLDQAIERIGEAV